MLSTLRFTSFYSMCFIRVIFFNIFILRSLSLSFLSSFLPFITFYIVTVNRTRIFYHLRILSRPANKNCNIVWTDYCFASGDWIHQASKVVDNCHRRELRVLA